MSIYQLIAWFMFSFLFSSMIFYLVMCIVDVEKIDIILEGKKWNKIKSNG